MYSSNQTYVTHGNITHFDPLTNLLSAPILPLEHYTVVFIISISLRFFIKKFLKGDRSPHVVTFFRPVKFSPQIDMGYFGTRLLS